MLNNKEVRISQYFRSEIVNDFQAFLVLFAFCRQEKYPPRDQAPYRKEIFEK
jgi:hypothetical protein